MGNFIAIVFNLNVIWFNFILFIYFEKKNTKCHNQ